MFARPCNVNLGDHYLGKTDGKSLQYRFGEVLITGENGAGKTMLCALELTRGAKVELLPGNRRCGSPEQLPTSLPNPRYG